jgi:O-antigen/teichoic acid export membrane protein
MVAILLVAQTSDFGLANAFAYHARHRPAVLRALLVILGRHVMLCVVIGTAVVLAAMRLEAVGLRDIGDPWWFPAVVVAAMAAGTAHLVLPVLVLAQGEYRAFTVFANGSIGLYVAAVAAVSATWGASWRRFIVVSLAVQVVIIALEVRFLLGRVRGPGERLRAAECYGYAFKSKLAELMKLIGTRLDLLIVAMVVPASHVGHYSLALGFREAGLIPLRTYGGILQNLMVDRQKARTDTRDVVIGTLLLQAASSLALWLGVALILPWAVPVLYGNPYSAAVGPAAVLFGSSACLSIAGICFIAFNMAGRPALSAFVMTVTALPVPAVTWLLTSRFGLYGAAVAALAGSFGTAVVALVVLARQRGFDRDDLQRVIVRLPDFVRHLATGMRPSHRRSVQGAQP